MRVRLESIISTPSIAADLWFGKVFRWTSNAMYVFAIQSLWLFGILAASKLALIAAAFQAVYIWVHYYATEKPDMAFIYRKQQ